jgi:hypothetical protein
MSAVAIGFGVAALVFVGGVAGMHLHRFLPREHLSKESRDVVMLGTGMLSVLASLVLDCRYLCQLRNERAEKSNCICGVPDLLSRHGQRVFLDPRTRSPL